MAELVAGAGRAFPVIAAEIRRRGPIPFRDYMALALYHPHRGYYAVDAPRIGPEGDFYTSPDLHAAFGGCLARQLAQMWCQLGCPARFDLVELGGGKGLLARDVFAWIDRHEPAFARAVRYTSIEISPALRARQRGLLADVSEAAERVCWAEPAAIAAGSLVGCILANEFYDALPVHRLTVVDGRLVELYVDLIEDEAPCRLVERAGPLSTPALVEHLARAGGVLPEGARMEVCPEAARWAAWSVGVLARGYTLTIDYGYPTRELYAPGRAGGTLRAYRQHTVTDDPYREPGEWDLTAHVDFGLLVHAAGALASRGTDDPAPDRSPTWADRPAEPAFPVGAAAPTAPPGDPAPSVGAAAPTEPTSGGATRRSAAPPTDVALAGFTRQGYFLAALGLGDALAALLDDPSTTLADYQQARRAVEALVRPDGLGAFRVLALAKHAPPDRLQGFTLLDERSALFD